VKEGVGDVGTVVVTGKDQIWLTSAPTDHPPTFFKRTAVGPAPHLPLPSNSFVSLGKRNAGPNPKTIPPHTGSLGEREKALGDVTQPLLHPTEPSLEVFDNVVW
jgi:hypothetical protein